LARFGAAVLPITGYTLTLFQQLSEKGLTTGQPRLLELCVEVLLYADTYTESEDCHLTEVIKELEILRVQAGLGELELLRRRKASALQSSILVSVFVVLPDLSLKVPTNLES